MCQSAQLGIDGGKERVEFEAGRTGRTGRTWSYAVGRTGRTRTVGPDGARPSQAAGFDRPVRLVRPDRSTGDVLSDYRPTACASSHVEESGPGDEQRTDASKPRQTNDIVLRSAQRVRPFSSCRRVV